MNTIIGDIATIETTLIVQVTFELIIDIVQDRLVTIACIDTIGIARCIDNGQTYFDTAFFDFDRRCFDFHRLTHFFYEEQIPKTKVSEQPQRKRIKCQTLSRENMTFGIEIG